MALNPDYVVSQGLQQLFADKDTGNFLRDGYVLFFRDTARTVGKPVYTLSGSPPNYTYVTYGFLDTNGAWRVDLNDQGAFDDVVYYYPLDADGNTDLYFIQVYSADDVFQFSVEGWPNFTEAVTDSPVDVNYVPNGQFLLHTDLPATDDYDAGEVRAAVTDIAWGGWTFNRPEASSAKDLVTFQRIGSYVSNPSASPRYQLRVETQIPNSGDSYKDIRLKYPDVNKFASTTDQYTFAFSARTNAGSSLSVQLILIKNYGTGGSPQTETSIKTFIIGNSETIYNATFTFGDNSGKTIGSNNDDYLQLALRLPTDSVLDISFTDMLMGAGALNQPAFPQTPDRQFISESLGGGFPVPAADGSDLYLLPRLTPTGWEYDHSEIGKIYAAVYETPGKGELLCDGSQYETDGYSSDGIPYRRLFNVLYKSDLGITLFGTGTEFVTCEILDSGENQIRLSTNAAASASYAADGSPATGFTFRQVCEGSNYNCQGLYAGTNLFFIWNNAYGQVNQPTNGTWTGNITRLRDHAELRALMRVEAPVAAGLAGTYFGFSTDFYNNFVWFTVDGSGSQPVVPGNPIRVNLLSSYNSSDVARIIAQAVSGNQISTIQTIAASGMTAGRYFTFATSTNNYYVWYKIDGVGTDPAPSGRIGILVNLNSTDTDIQVASKTAVAINSKYFAVPDLRGKMLRGLASGSAIIYDPGANERWSNNILLNGNKLGTFEFDDFLLHTHGLSDSAGETNPAVGSFGNGSLSPINQKDTAYAGGGETRPLNMAVNYVIKY